MIFLRLRNLSFMNLVWYPVKQGIVHKLQFKHDREISGDDILMGHTQKTFLARRNVFHIKSTFVSDPESKLQCLVNIFNYLEIFGLM